MYLIVPSVGTRDHQGELGAHQRKMVMTFDLLSKDLMILFTYMLIVAIFQMACYMHFKSAMDNLTTIISLYDAPRPKIFVLTFQWRDFFCMFIYSGLCRFLESYFLTSQF